MNLIATNYAQDYLSTRRAMDIVGISQKEQGQEIDSSVLKDDKSKFHLKTTAELLMCDHNAALEDALLRRVMLAVIKRSLDPDGATVSRDGLGGQNKCLNWARSKFKMSDWSS